MTSGAFTSCVEKPAPGPGDFSGLEIPLGGGLWRRVRSSGLLGVGYALVALHVLVLVGGGAAVVALQHGERHAYPVPAAIARVMTWSTLLVPLVAFCLILMGDLMRRGTFGRARAQQRDAVLPQGTNAVTFRMIGTGWHLVWVVVSAAALVGLTAAVAHYGWWTGRNGPITSALTAWAVNGIFAAGSLGATVGSLVKKLVYARTRRRVVHSRAELDALHPALRRRLGASAGASGGRSAFWRWFGYRWRLDLWVCALGTTMVWAAIMFLLMREWFPDDAAAVDRMAVVVLPGGVVLLALGLAATTQFWRAGEELASGESVS